jgi:hypothetical protein
MWKSLLKFHMMLLLTKKRSNFEVVETGKGGEWLDNYRIFWTEKSSEIGLDLISA